MEAEDIMITRPANITITTGIPLINTKTASAHIDLMIRPDRIAVVVAAA